MRIFRLVIIFTSVFCITTANSQTVELTKAKAVITEMLKSKFEVQERIKTKWKYLGLPIGVIVTDTSIELTYENKPKTIHFSDELKIEKNYIILGTFSIDIFSGGISPYYKTKADEELDFKVLKRSIFYMCNLKTIRLQDSLLTQFKSKAEQYRALTVKPMVTEEQREYIVQANALNQQKQYAEAIALYKQAIETDPTAYPAAYSNLALLSAQIGKFDEAIFNMKKYLMLVPEAEDARAAQDKIYEWKINTY